jgi:hypothetical protein
MKKEYTIIIVLAALLVIAGCYIAYGRYAAMQAQVYQAGGQVGYQQAIVDIMKQAYTCQPVPLYAGNQSLKMIAVECLQQQNTQTEAQTAETQTP